MAVGEASLEGVRDDTVEGKAGCGREEVVPVGQIGEQHVKERRFYVQDVELEQEGGVLEEVNSGHVGGGLHASRNGERMNYQS